MSIEDRNYYDLLGLQRCATLEEIKEAYHERARLYHPDSNFYSEIIDNTLSPEELAKFQAITAAYTTLSHKNKRAEYDAKLPPELKGWDEEPDLDEYLTPPTPSIDTPQFKTERAPGTISRDLLKEVVNREVEEVEEEGWTSLIFFAVAAGLTAGMVLLWLYS